MWSSALPFSLEAPVHLLFVRVTDVFQMISVSCVLNFYRKPHRERLWNIIHHLMVETSMERIPRAARLPARTSWQQRRRLLGQHLAELTAASDLGPTSRCAAAEHSESESWNAYWCFDLHVLHLRTSQRELLLFLFPYVHVASAAHRKAAWSAWNIPLTVGLQPLSWPTDVCTKCLACAFLSDPVH